MERLVLLQGGGQARARAEQVDDDGGALAQRLGEVAKGQAPQADLGDDGGGGGRSGREAVRGPAVKF
ncbi:hypothetical protein [Caulobacter endophyticus]|uniref:hypothetical protein n=1 Tax=Caulobacter endophyticus TaxID=2172652 RepID=UPI001E474497|nr:hypothetical protein [Caulobacter endophyticus]